ncbi:MAG: CPBP family intramembrane metalloprotease [Nitrosomonas sp.]|nr:CPBP family intramembrane metalloprotease [Nitrosomonas sp.]
MIINRLLLRIFIKSEIYLYQSLKKNLSKVDYKVIAICVVVPFVLTCNFYFGDFRFLVSILRDFNLLVLAQRIEDVMTIYHNAQLYQLLYWATVISFFYFVVPSILVICFFREKLTAYGLGLNGAFKDYKLYVLMLIIMIPLVFYFSDTDGFQAKYPFYEVAKGESLYPNFLVWQLFYFLQFFALEFFFRGFILHGTKQRFGFYAIFVMTIPYCMIHFGKPMVETIAAIIAGIILGVLSLKSRSIWLGVMIHCSVAFVMDLSVLYRKGVLHDQWNMLIGTSGFIE